jgi:UDP:flavonoid glycosyltransferase YjiC (YdhE family)
LPRPKVTAGELAAAIGAAVTDPAHRERAESLAAAIKLENGPARVVAAVEGRLRA